MRDNQATTKKIRFMSHVSPSDRTQKPAKKKKKKKSQRGKILDHRPYHLSLSTYCISSSRLSLSFLSLMHTEGKTQTFLSPPPGERVNGPLIPRSEDQSQQGGHVCQIKKKKRRKKPGVAMLTRELRCTRLASVRIEKQGEEDEWRRKGRSTGPCNSLQRKKKRVAVPARLPPRVPQPLLLLINTTRGRNNLFSSAMHQTAHGERNDNR